MRGDGRRWLQPFCCWRSVAALCLLCHGTTAYFLWLVCDGNASIATLYWFFARVLGFMCVMAQGVKFEPIGRDISFTVLDDVADVRYAV